MSLTRTSYCHWQWKGWRHSCSNARAKPKPSPAPYLQPKPSTVQKSTQIGKTVVVDATLSGRREHHLHRLCLAIHADRDAANELLHTRTNMDRDAWPTFLRMCNVIQLPCLNRHPWSAVSPISAVGRLVPQRGQLARGSSSRTLEIPKLGMVKSAMLMQ